MTPYSFDISSRVSPQLSALFRSRTEDPDIEEPVTLEAVRRYLESLLPADFTEAEQRHHFDVGESLLDELDALIEEFGETALAEDFEQVRASEALTRVIESTVDDDNRSGPPTLAAVRAALLSGLNGKLVGEGVLEDDEDDSLLAEIDALIKMFGADAPAESLLGYDQG